MVKKLDINFHKAISDDPLVLLKTDASNYLRYMAFWVPMGFYSLVAT